MLRYNPQGTYKINFNWMFEATEENKNKLQAIKYELQQLHTKDRAIKLVESDEGMQDFAQLEDLFETLNKSEIDRIVSDNWELYSTGSLGLDISCAYQKNDNWIDCGKYYKLNNVVINHIFEGEISMDVESMGKLSEVRVRKDGKFTYIGKCNQLTGEVYDDAMTIDEWFHSDDDYAQFALPQGGVLFDEKG